MSENAMGESLLAPDLRVHGIEFPVLGHLRRSRCQRLVRFPLNRNRRSDILGRKPSAKAAHLRCPIAHPLRSLMSTPSFPGTAKPGRLLTCAARPASAPSQRS
jgi:hypothetical protein